MLKHGINVGLTRDAKSLLSPAMAAVEASTIINDEGHHVDWLHIVTRADGQSFVEAVTRTAGHRSGITAFFVSLVDRQGAVVPVSVWSDEEMREALAELERTNTVAFVDMLRRGPTAPPTSWTLN
jgi:hypothetical protein